MDKEDICLSFHVFVFCNEQCDICAGYLLSCTHTEMYEVQGDRETRDKCGLDLTT